MIQPKSMTKIRVVTPQTKLPKVIETLHALKIMHLLDHKKTQILDIGKPLPNAEETAALILKTQTLCAAFEQNKKNSETKKNKQKKITDFHDVKQKIEEIAYAWNAIHEKKSSLVTLIAEKKEIVMQLKIIAALDIDTDAILPYKTLATYIGTVAAKDGFEKEIQHAAKESIVKTTTEKQKIFAAVFTAKKHSTKIEKILEKYKYKQYLFKNLSLYDGFSEQHAEKEELLLQLLEKDLLQIEAEAQKIKLQEGSYVHAAEKWLQKEVEKAEAPLRFGETKHACIIEGWVTKQEYQNLKKSLENAAEEKIHIEITEIRKTDKIPIVLDNILFVKPYEFFLNLYTLPNYKEMDPSFLMFFSFPFFFGLMLGDVGYGLVTLLLFAVLWWKMKKTRNLLTAMMFCAIVTIFFGFVFGEYFGFEHVSEETGKYLVEQYKLPLHQEIIHNGELVYSFPRIINRLHGEIEMFGNTLPAVLVIGGIIGFIHVNLGLFLGFINEIVFHGFKHAFFAKISWYVLELGVAVTVLSKINLIAIHWLYGFGVILFAAGMLFIGEGIQGIVEIPGILTNILSYLRLGAVGLSSVGLAVVINENLAMPFLEKGGLYIIIAVCILIVGHLINIALGILGPFLHSLRLHYVEFFSKFYKGGGIPFVAFGEEKESEN